MITTALFSVVALVVNATFGALPSSPSLGLNTLAGTVVSDGFFNHLGWANSYLPLDSVVSGIGVLLALLGVMYLVRIVLWLLGKFHVTGGSE